MYYFEKSLKKQAYETNDKYFLKYGATDLHNTIHELIKMYVYKNVDTGKSHTQRVNGKLAEFSNEV